MEEVTIPPRNSANSTATLQTFRERGIRIANPQRSVVAYADGSRPVVEGENGGNGGDGGNSGNDHAAEPAARPPSPAEPERKPG